MTATVDEDEVVEAVGLGVRGLVLKEMAARGRPPVDHSADDVPVLDSLQPSRGNERFRVGTLALWPIAWLMAALAFGL